MVFTPDESGREIQPNKKNAAAATVPYDDSPPRLIAALNDAETMWPPGTKNVDPKAIAPALDGDDAMKWPKVGAPATSDPPTHELPIEPASIKSILTWIGNRLYKADFDKQVWPAQEVQLKRWKPDQDGDVEEAWSKTFSEMLLGVTYGGPGQSYFMDGAWDAYIFSRLQQKARKVRPYEQQEKDQWGHPRKVIRGSTTVPSWRNPLPLPAPLPKRPDPGDWDANSDPAVSVVVACQHLATYGTITRGWLVEDDLGNAGYAASQSSGTLPIFTGKPWTSSQTVVSGGKFYGIGTDTKSGKLTFRQSQDAGTIPLEKLRDAKFATSKDNLDPPIAPGSIFTYNPHGDLSEIEVYITRYEEKYEAKAVASRAMYYHWHNQSQPGSKVDASQYFNASRDKQESRVVPRRIILKKKKGESQEEHDKKQLDADMERSKEQTLCDAPSALQPSKKKLTLGSDQDPGSHINFVLRVHPKKDRVQLFDTNGNACYTELEKQHHGLILRGIQGGIVDDEAIDKVYEGTTFVGSGVIPPGVKLSSGGGAPDRDVAEQTKQNKKARPVGLARLVLTMRDRVLSPQEKKAIEFATSKNQLLPPPSAPKVTKDDILYVSKLLRTYGNDSDKKLNFYISRYLWSLRNTPGFSNVQPWWFICIPKDLLARSMWAHGGREMTLRMFVDQVLPDATVNKPPPKDAMPSTFGGATTLVFDRHYTIAVVLTNRGGEQADQAGKAMLWRRYKSALGEDGNTQAKGEGVEVPNAILQMLKEQPWDQEYLHAKLNAKNVVDPPDASGKPETSPLDYFRYP